MQEKDSSTDNLYRIAFCTHLVGFTRQAIKGIIISSYRYLSSEGTFKTNSAEEVMGIIRKRTFIYENMVNYINSNWKGYNEQSDTYITNVFSSLIKFGSFKHNSCIFLFVWDFIQSVLTYVVGRITKEHIISTDVLRESLEMTLDSRLANFVDNIMFEDFSCNDSCEPIEYDDTCLINF
jgi:hypothetical protein